MGTRILDTSDKKKRAGMVNAEATNGCFSSFYFRFQKGRDRKASTKSGSGIVTHRPVGRNPVSLPPHPSTQASGGKRTDEADRGNRRNIVTCRTLRGQFLRADLGSPLNA